MSRSRVEKRLRPATLADVAARAHVSPGLVSRLLNGDSTVRLKDDTRRAILDAVTDLGYVANSSARALRKSKSGAIGLVLNSVTSPMYSALVDAAQREAAANGYLLILIDIDEVDEDNHLFFDLIAARRVDALLVQGGFGARSVELMAAAAPLPTVTFNARGSGAVPGIRLQDRRAAVLATKHLLDLGHESVVYVSGPEGETSDERLAGFTEALEAAGQSFDSSRIVRGGWSADECHAAVVAHLATHEEPTAFVVVNALSAVGVISAIHRLDRRIPEDISIIAIHDTWFAPHLTPGLSCVRLPLDELGAWGVRRVIDLLDGRTRDDDIVITTPPPELISRRSTASRP